LVNFPSLEPFFLCPPSIHPLILSFINLPGGNLARGAPTKKGRSTSGHCVLSVIGSISLP
jgi:hypothetical protein